jgi:hypothetical protein
MRIELKLATREGIDNVTVNARVSSEASVLAFHHRLLCGEVKASNGWSVTHVPTGKNIGLVFRTMKQARIIAREFGERPEWDAIGSRGGTGYVSPDFVKELKTRVRMVCGSDWNEVARLNEYALKP